MLLLASAVVHSYRAIKWEVIAISNEGKKKERTQNKKKE